MSGYPPVLASGDASDSRNALSELERARSLIEGIFAALPCGVAIINRDYQVIDANWAYFSPLGYDRSEVRSRHCYEAFSRYPNPCSMLGESCPIAVARAANAVGRVHREHRLPDGRVRDLEYTANPLLDEHGGISAFVVVVHDVTNLREVKEHLQQTRAALEELNREYRRHHEEQKEDARRLEQARMELVKLGRAKSELIAAISQELRTPLAAISEGVGLVEDGSCGALSHEQQTFLQLASKNIKRLTDLLNDLLDLSRIEAGGLVLHRRPLDLCRIAREAAATHDCVARSNHQTLKVDLPADLEPVLADEESILRILNNLVGNAIKFTPGGGRITIAADRLPSEAARGVQPTAHGSNSGPSAVSPQPSATMIAVSVSDTDPGVSGAQEARPTGLAEPAKQSDLARLRGTSLGLALCRQLVKLNGGRLVHENHEASGSCFSFSLPVYTEFAGLTAALHFFASALADPRNGTPAVYFCRVRPGEKANGLLPRLEELLASVFPKPAVPSVVDSGHGVLVFAPRTLPETELRPVLESLKRANLLADKQERNVHLQFATLNYDQFRLKLQTLVDGRAEPSADQAAQWWDALFGELEPGLTEIR
jgi:PAS domain S-box-containing protein